MNNLRVVFQTIKSENPLNSSGVSGYVSNCFNCGDWIIVRFKIKSLCLECTANNLMIKNPKSFSSFYRTGAWRRIRQVVFDLKGRVCVYCYKKATHIDHSNPIKRGGDNSIENLQPVCNRCNFEKRTKTHQEYLSTRKTKLRLITTDFNSLRS